jgi:hypothetical protein
MDALAERLADALSARAKRERAKRKAERTRRKARLMRQRVETLGTRSFKTMQGLYSAVARSLDVNRIHVYQVAKGYATSPRVLKALREEIALRAVGSAVVNALKGGEQ